MPVWRTGDRVRWRDRIGDFRRDVGDGEHAEIKIADRAYRVRLARLSPIRVMLAATAPPTPAYVVVSIGSASAY
jgi:hypothetical protein